VGIALSVLDSPSGPTGGLGIWFEGLRVAIQGFGFG